MYILDRELSWELLSDKVDPQLLTWIASQTAADIWITTISVFELRSGIEMMPPGRKRKDLERRYRDIFTYYIGDRIAPFDLAAAEAAGTLVAMNKQARQMFKLREMQIAGIVLANRARLVTMYWGISQHRYFGLPTSHVESIREWPPAIFPI